MSDNSQAILPPHGGQLRQIAARYGIPAEKLLDFSANINPAGPPPSALRAIQQALQNPTTLTAYPDLEQVELKQALADYASILPENIAVANGFVPLLEASIRSLRIQRCLVPVPAFSEYRRALEKANVAVIPYRLSGEDGFQYEHNAILKAVSSSSCDAILLANPQNPSGTICTCQQMLHLIEAAEQLGVRVLLDEAFIDYYPNHSLTLQSVQHANLIVFRSVTKFFAMPGLRVAYAVSNSSMVQSLNLYIAPWPIATLAVHAVCAALRDESYAEESRLSNERGRFWMQQKLQIIGLPTYKSATNFLLLRLPSHVDPTVFWERMILDHQVVLRSCVNFEGLATGHFRVAVRSEQENERLICCVAIQLG